ncbi:MAG: hypothetical protein ACRD8O_18850, partial [Bryobacteraceae bacterium]
IYQVSVDVRNNHFTTKVNGRIVDSWTDPVHRAGGVGFASESGEIARVRWLKVADKDDFVGKVCAFLTASVIPGHLLPTDEVLSAHSYFLDSVPTL